MTSIEDDRDGWLTIALGSAIRDARKELGWTGAELAVRCEVQESTIASWERGRYPLKVTVFVRLCGILGVHAGALLTLAVEQVRVYEGRASLFRQGSHPDDPPSATLSDGC